MDLKLVRRVGSVIEVLGILRLFTRGLKVFFEISFAALI